MLLLSFIRWLCECLVSIQLSVKRFSILCILNFSIKVLIFIPNRRRMMTTTKARDFCYIRQCYLILRAQLETVGKWKKNNTNNHNICLHTEKSARKETTTMMVDGDGVQQYNRNQYKMKESLLYVCIWIRFKSKMSVGCVSAFCIMSIR